MTQRINFATALAAGRLPLKQSTVNAMEQMGEAKTAAADRQSLLVEPVDPASLIKVIGPMLSRDTKATIENSRPAFRAPLILGSPGFMHR
jgi:hypothetical protein